MSDDADRDIQITEQRVEEDLETGLPDAAPERLAYTLFTFRSGRREIRARRFDDEQSLPAVIEFRKWSSKGWGRWEAFDLIPYFDPFFCAVARELYVRNGCSGVEILLPTLTERYQRVEIKRLKS